MNCKICDSESSFLFKGEVLNKYSISYFKCEKCGFIQTESPYWLEEAYSQISKMIDVGMVSRNLFMAKITKKIIKRRFCSDKIFVDYGGGYGLFVRLMRDSGFDYFRYDKYSTNIFAQFFDVNDLPIDTKFELATAFEVFEHITDPVNEIKQILSLSDSVLFSTYLQPRKKLTSQQDWWYFAPQGGQHISFYNKQSLQIIAQKNNASFFTNGKDLHLISKKIKRFHFPLDITVLNIKKLIRKNFANISTEKDFDIVLLKLHNK